MTLGRRAVLAGALAFVASFESKALAQTPAAQPVAPLTSLASLSALLESRRAVTKVPALAAAVFGVDAFLMEAAVGVRRAGAPAPATTRDIWHVGSCTKAMTAALYARFVERGLAHWDAKLPDLFPDLAADIAAAWRDTTIDQVFAHRAGLSDIDPLWLSERRNDKHALPTQRTMAVRNWLSRPPSAKAGGYLYSSVGYIIAGAAIERITNGAWEDAMREHIFRPLMMTSAGFGPPQGDAPQGHRASLLGGFTAVGAGPIADNPAVVGPAGTVHVSFADWARFARVFIDPKQTFLKPETVRRLVTPLPGQDYCYGWGVYEESLGGHIFSHVGSNTIWMARITLQPDQRLGSFVVCNANSEEATRPIGRSLMAAIRAGAIH